MVSMGEMKDKKSKDKKSGILEDETQLSVTWRYHEHLSTQLARSEVLKLPFGTKFLQLFSPICLKKIIQK